MPLLKFNEHPLWSIQIDRESREADEHLSSATRKHKKMNTDAQLTLSQREGVAKIHDEAFFQLSQCGMFPHGYTQRHFSILFFTFSEVDSED